MMRYNCIAALQRYSSSHRIIVLKQQQHYYGHMKRRWKASATAAAHDQHEDAQEGHTKLEEAVRITTQASPSPLKLLKPNKLKLKDSVTYTGNVILPLTFDLKIVQPREYANGIFHRAGNDCNNNKFSGLWPVFRILNEDGSCPVIPFNNNKNHLNHQQIQAMEEMQSEAMTHEMYRCMIRLSTMDHILESAQRQGRISFYLQCRGEEAIHIGSASALTLKDTIFGQYREQGILMWRGFTLEQFTDQCFSNERDLGRGRQMPVHYVSKALNFHAISSPLCTQLPHAVGAAYRMKLQYQRDNIDVANRGCAVVYFGEGAASEGDFHAACNFAATLRAPVVFFCRNNGYAISTPTTSQYSPNADGIIGRAPGYGIPGIRVDGNDVFAVHAATLAAKELALSENTPVLIEAMTYRMSHHSTSDDSTQYRDKAEIERWKEEGDPIVRLQNFMRKRGYIDEDDVEAFRARIAKEERMAVMAAMKKSEAKKKPSLDTMFEDVYGNKPPHLLRQEEEMRAHLAKYPEHYKV
mmetsp:Transcript_19366/g.29877  ORF Transcript_19366/g.29877 Transcript_19366/m.29877 type:complete len:524 (+) Transcript_19366:31-1602(+)